MQEKEFKNCIKELEVEKEIPISATSCRKSDDSLSR